MGTFDYLRDYNPIPAGNAGAAGGASPSPTGAPAASVPGAKEGLKLGSYDPAKGRRDAGTAPASFEGDRGRGHNSYLREARADDQRTEDYFSAPVSFENFGDRYQQYMGSVAAMAGEYNRKMGSYQDPESAQAYADDSRKRMYQSNAQGRELWRFLTTNRDAVEKTIGAEGYASLTKSLMDAIGGTLDLSRGAAQNVDFLGSFANEGAFNAFRAYREEHPEEELGSAWQQSQADYFGGFEDRLKAAEQEYKEAREDYNRVLYSPEALNYDEAMSAAAARVTEAKAAYEKAKQENETRGYTEAQMAHRAELIGEYQKLQGKSKTAVTQEEIEQTRKDAARMLEIRQELERMDAAVGRVQDYSLMDRGTSVLTGTAKNLGGSLMNAAVTFADAIWNDRGDAFLSSAGEYELGGANVNTLRQSIEKEFNDPVKRAKWNSIYAVADNLSESARMDLERAKGGLGWFGQAGVDIAENVLEMGFDAGMAALTGGGSLASMFLRTFGSSAQEARLAGADRSGQVAYGIAKGAIEVATEKLADGVAGIYGKGGADEITEELIRKMAGSRTGRTMLRLFAGAVGEGTEEVLSDVLSPLAERLYKNENLLELYKQLDPAEILYDFIIGAAIGGFGGTATLFNGQNKAANIELDLADVGLGSRDTAVNDMWNALTGRLTPEQQTKRAERAQQRLGLTDEQLARARQGLQLGSLEEQTNENAAPEGTAERTERETPAPGNIINTNSGSGIIWAGSERAGETAGNPTQTTPEPTLGNAAGNERAESGPPRASAPAGMDANTEGGVNYAEGQQSEQRILGQEEAQPAGGTDAGPGGEADIDRERTETLEPAGLREEGAGVSDGGRGRDAGARAGRAADRVDERTRRHPRREGEQGQRAAARRHDGAALRERGEAQAISARELGIRNGTAEQNLTIVPGQAWDSEMRETAQRVYDETGYGVVYVIGAIRVQAADGVTHPVRGVIADDVLILQADHSRTSITQLADHEIFHALVRSDPGLREAARQKVIERYTPEEFRRMMDSYLVNLGGLYGDMSTEQAAEIIMEEILADAYADINFFGYGADRFGSAVRETTQERAGAQQAQGTQETRGPPERYSGEESSEETVVKVNKGPSAKGGDKRTAAYVLADHLNELQEMSPVSELTGREMNDRSKDLPTKIAEFFKSVGGQVNRKGLGTVILGEYGVGGIMNHKPINRAKMVTLVSVPEVIKNGRIINYDPNWKGRGYPSIIIAAPVTVAGQTVYVAAVIDQREGYKFYLNECVDSEGNYIRITEDPSGNTKSGVTAQDGVTRGPEGSSDNSIRSSGKESNRNFLQENEHISEDSEQIPGDSEQLFSADDSEFDEAMPEDRELLLNAAARDGAHPEVTAWGKKQARIETLERKAANLREAMENADEEERAEMQPILDKAEGQLRRAREDAAKMEGSPIIKRALDRERAAWREENPTEAAAAMRSLQQENKAMQERVEYWKGQAKRTADTDRTVMPEDTRRMARNLLREHGSEASTDRIAGALQRLGNYIVSGEDLDFDRIMKEARGIAREILGSAYFFSDESRDIREELRDYLRQNRLKISDELRGDMADFADFRRRNMGTLRLANEGLPIDTAYMELQNMFGEGLFPSSVTAHSDMLNQILNAMERVQPSYEKIYQKGRLLDEMVGHVANEIFDGLLSGEVRQSKTMADRQFEAMGRRNANLSERNQQLQDQLRGEKNMRRELVQEKVTELRQRSISKDKAYRKRVEIDKKVKRLSKSLIENSAKNHVPESMKNMVGGLLTSIDTLSPRSGEKARQDYIRRMNELEKVANKQQAYMNGAKNENDMFLDLPPDLGELLRQHMDSIQEAMDGDRTWTTAKMDLKQLEDLDTILTVVSKAVTTANDLLADRRSGKVSEVASGTVKDLDKLGEVGADNMLTRFLQFQNTTPYYFFKRFGEGGQRIFRNLQEGWGKLAFNAREIIDYAEKTYTAKEARDAEKEIHEFKLSKRLLENDGGEELRSEERETVRLSKAQIMEIYALSRRPQALGHLLSAGIRIADIKQGVGKSIRQADNYLLTGEDLATITGTLTEREKAIVDALQKHMNTVGSEWGNEVSMARYGIRQFTEENYWPIKTDSRSRDVRDPGRDQTNLFRLLNMSFTKNTVRDAHNAIVIGSAFDTYANHMADMAKYNALGLPMLDAMKWFNYNNESEKNEAGQYTTASVQKSADRAFGEEAKNYFIQFMKDMNGTHEGGRDLEHFASRALSNYKVAAVGANLRVALLQPTAYVRAAAVLDPKYLVKGAGMSNKQGRAEAMKYSGTAVWKDLGFYDTNINTGLREMIKHTDSFVDTLKEKSMRAAEWGDKTTWGALWNACKAQVQETQNLKGEELMKATAELFDEVVYRTQVMDSTMTRSHNMRQKGVFAGMTTAFMAEPTLSYNMMLDAYNEFQTEKRKGGDTRKALAEAGPKVARSVAAYMATAAAAAIAESLMDAWRDDDKYQSFLDKWLEAMFGGEKITDGNLLQDLLIHNKLPFIKDFDNLINGYKSSRMDTEWMTNVVKTWQIWKETAELATGKLEKPTDITYNGKMTWYGKLYQTLKTASQMTGLPIGNAAREAVALWDNTVGQATGNIITTYDPGEKNQIKYAVKDGYLSEEEAARYLMEQGVFDDESKAKAQVFQWKAEAQGEKIDTKQAAAVQALAETGTSTEDAVTTVADIWKQIEELTPMEGSTSVAKTQRYAVVVNSDLSVEQQMSMLGVLMSEDELNKTETAYQYGITPQRYINNKTSMYEVSQKLSGDGQVSGEEAQIALEQNQSFSNEERAILWQLQNNGWAAENNPFDQEIGKRVYDAMHGGSSEGLTLGSANQQTAGTAAASADEGLRLGSSEEPKTGTWIPEAWDQPLKLGSW